MNPRYLYLLIDLGAISIPLAASFYARAPFYKLWRYLWLALLIPALIFLAWDAVFTAIGVWGFNPEYLSGYYFLNLPIEEVLFFFCIPYACTFTYFALGKLVEKDHLYFHQELISSGLSIGLLIAGLYHLDKLYTGITFMSLGTFLALQMLFLRPRYMGRFYLAYAVILIPFFIVNGLLTGSWIQDEVVWYNNDENLGIRIGTIPLEDIFYGMLLIVMNITILERLKRHDSTLV